MDTRDGTSPPLPSTAVYLDPFENVIWYFVPLASIWLSGPSQMRELSGRMNALISQDNSTLALEVVPITIVSLYFDDRSTELCVCVHAPRQRMCVCVCVSETETENVCVCVCVCV